MKNIKFKTVEEYFKNIPSNAVDRMNSIRKIIKTGAPMAEEVISYNMPALKYNGILIYYAAYKDYIGFYPTPSAIAQFKDELENYKWAKGSVQFPHNEHLPLDLIKKMTAFRYQEKSGENE